MSSGGGAAANAGGRSGSLLDLDEGFLALPRRLCASPFFVSLRADERSVVITMLLAARYAEGGEFWFAGKRIPLAPGQFIDAEETLAAAAGTTRKVTRTVLRKCVTAGLVVRSRVHPAGQCPTVTTVVDYERIRFAGGEAGQRTGQRTGQQGANEGPANGPANGPHQNKGNKETTEPGNTDLAPPPAAPARSARREPEGSRHHAVIARFCALWTELRGGTYRVATTKDGAAVKRLLGYEEATDDEIDRRMRAAFSDPFFLTKAGGLAFFVAKWSTWEPPKGAPRVNGAPVPAMAEPEFTGKAGGF